MIEQKLSFLLSTVYINCIHLVPELIEYLDSFNILYSGIVFWTCLEKALISIPITNVLRIWSDKAVKLCLGCCPLTGCMSCSRYEKQPVLTGKPWSLPGILLSRTAQQMLVLLSAWELCFEGIRTNSSPGQLRLAALPPLQHIGNPVSQKKRSLVSRATSEIGITWRKKREEGKTTEVP